MRESIWQMVSGICSLYILISWMHMKVQRGEWTRFECGVIVFIALIITIVQVVAMKHQ